MACCSRSKSESQLGKKKEPVVNIEKIIKQAAWKELEDDPPEGLTCMERLYPISKVVMVEVDKAFFDVRPCDGSHSPATFYSRQDTNKGNKVVLFTSRFENGTAHSQTYSFRTERQTCSRVELSLQKGFTMGTSLELDAKIPSIGKFFDLGGKLGGQLQWSFSRGKTSSQEEQVTWSVENNITVEPNKIGTASLMVTEHKFDYNYTLPCTIRALPYPPIKEEMIRESGEGGLHHSQGSDVTTELKHQGDDRDHINEEVEADGCSDKEVVALQSETNTPVTSSKSTPKRPTSVRVPVFVRHRSTQEVLQVICLPWSMVIKGYEDHFKIDPNDRGVIACELAGRCHVVCATEQYVRLEECALAPPPNGE